MDNEDLAIKVSDILNDTGAWQKIVDLLESERNIKVDADSTVFNDIEENIVELMLNEFS